jgi:hypothetical protein
MRMQPEVDRMLKVYLNDGVNMVLLNTGLLSTVLLLDWNVNHVFEFQRL